MPQMAPLSWLTLFLYFTLILILVNPLNYFLCLSTSTSTNYSKLSNPVNWKW